MWEDQELLASERELESLAQYEPEADDAEFEAWLATLGERAASEGAASASASTGGGLRPTSPAFAAAFLAALSLITGCGGSPVHAAVTPVSHAERSAAFFQQLAAEYPKAKHPRKVRAESECPAGVSAAQCAAAAEYNACIRSATGCSAEQLAHTSAILFPPLAPP
jgi:hypothetical protein